MGPTFFLAENDRFVVYAYILDFVPQGGIFIQIIQGFTQTSNRSDHLFCLIQLDNSVYQLDHSNRSHRLKVYHSLISITPAFNLLWCYSCLQNLRAKKEQKVNLGLDHFTRHTVLGNSNHLHLKHLQRNKFRLLSGNGASRESEQAELEVS